MKGIIVLPLLAVVLSAPASAQDGRFPLGKTYKAISITGFDVQNMAMTLAVTRNPAGEYRGSGHAGCNGWSASVMLREDQIDFVGIATTRKFCGKPRMTAEEAFVTSLRSAKRWRAEGDRLIIEGDAARLLLKSAAEGSKGDGPENKAAKKPAKSKAGNKKE
jgi:heat shock protein HslJ